MYGNFHKKIMDIEFRPASTGKQIGSATIYEYKAKNPKCITLQPIPEWLQGSTCIKCGGKAKFLLEDLTMICSACVMIETKNCDVILNTKSDLSVPLTMDVLQHQAFEWSTDGNKWYRIHGKKIVIDGNTEKFVQAIKESLVNKTNAEFRAEYDKDDTKIMTIHI